jgi:hypothetical protein
MDLIGVGGVGGGGDDDDDDTAFLSLEGKGRGGRLGMLVRGGEKGGRGGGILI